MADGVIAPVDEREKHIDRCIHALCERMEQPRTDGVFWIYSMTMIRHRKRDRRFQCTHNNNSSNEQHTLENHMGLWLCVLLLHRTTCALGYCRFYVNVMLFLLPAYFWVVYLYFYSMQTLQSRGLSEFFFSSSSFNFTSFQLDSNWICTFCHFISH